MKKKIEKYLRSKNADSSARIRDEIGRFLVGDDFETCLRATQQSAFPPKRPKVLSKPKETRSLPPYPTLLAPYNTPLPHYASSKRSYDVMSGPMYSDMKYASHKRPYTESPKATRNDMEVLNQFFQTLRGGYVNGIYQSALERRRLAEKSAKHGTTEALNYLNLTLDERDRLPSVFKKKVRNLEPYRGREYGTSSNTLPYGYMQWARPSPLIPIGEPHSSTPSSSGKPYKNSLLSHTSLKLSPLSRSKETEKGKFVIFELYFSFSFSHFTNNIEHCQIAYSVSEKTSSPLKMSGPLIATPAAKSSRSSSSLTPLLPTPLNHRSEAFGDGWGTPSWGGEEAKILEGFLSSRGLPSSAVTPGIMRSSAARAYDAPPSSIGKMHTPRVFFKDQLTETINFKYQQESHPLPVRLRNHLFFTHSQPVLNFSIDFFRQTGNSTKPNENNTIEGGCWSGYRIRTRAQQRGYTPRRKR